MRLLCGLLLSVLYGQISAQNIERIEWKGSRVIGSPDPPLPYVTRKVWDNLPVKKPLELKRVPGTTDLLAYVDHHESKQSISSLWVFKDTQEVKTKIESLTLENDLIYGFCFHPKFKENGFIFLHTSGPRRGDGSKKKRCRITRWVMDQKTYLVDSNSEKIFVEWESNGHDGGGVIFGLDGMLYITTGDGSSDSDINLTGQRIDLLLSKVLRINVDQIGKGKPYSIPEDNPFLNTKNAAPETWAHGFRNPWRITCDTKTGDIWVGENGQDMWESVKRVERGANYGWSKYEGSHPFYLERKLGPGRLRKPTFEHHHREARSLTGGVVYYGKGLPELNGAYVYGDYATGKIWAGKNDGQKVLWHKEIADTSFAITGFASDVHGNLIVIDERTGFYKLILNENREGAAKFPLLLSETGLFKNVSKHEPAPGVFRYEVNVPHWVDGANSEHFLAVPGSGKMRFNINRGWDAPDQSVLVQTLSVEKQRIETRLLTKQQGEWSGYSYKWNKAQTDALLVDREGEFLSLSVNRNWNIPSRAECMMCHARAAKYTLGLTGLQMNRDVVRSGKKVNQITYLAKQGVLDGVRPEKYEGKLGLGQSRLPNPYDSDSDLQTRVRSYWKVNCAHCHIEAGGGNSQINLEWGRALKDTLTVGVKPVHSSFGLGEQAEIVSPGKISHSVMLQRIIRPENGRMPPVGGVRPDLKWIELFTQWVSELKPDK